MAKQQLRVFAQVFDKRGRLLSCAVNSYVKTHTVQAKAADKVGRPSSIYLHAEIAALIKIKDWTKAHKMVVLRHLKDGTPALAKPCLICQHVINQTGIKHIEWSTNDNHTIAIP